MRHLEAQREKWEVYGPSACGLTIDGGPSNPADRLTHDLSLVECRRCQRTGAFRWARREATRIAQEAAAPEA